ncbi:hypothetical protein PC41400_01635 [Paenibacillus chitinolyticus]|uniref:Uncharacterized protein n=1 Tax=Paenibacillus chitinolyticus TaxID=79263 RepID=A0A410WQ33_9BACL|nr:hypothetical protein [Paenibacillus chitinolyticus]MCY9591035.1 hypothetical protein [Paenibacillus chitinolyticus]MCY9597164.1 hypothetical protein [Paenibacillus chitinolyticus]QAV16465.1 hypothetical protein PC41400_01635 [Paenibacillus chitinolyticus]
MKVLKWLLAIVFYHSFMFGVIIATLFMPFIIYGDIKKILINEVPVASGGVIVISLLAFFIYLAMRSKFLGIPYRKITILLPALQMLIYTSFALSVGVIILNKWADEGLYSKGWAITLLLLAIAAIRLCMSLLYWKYPVVRRTNRYKE